MYIRHGKVIANGCGSFPSTHTHTHLPMALLHELILKVFKGAVEVGNTFNINELKAKK